MKHLHVLGLSLFLILTIQSTIQSQFSNRSAMPFDMVFVGFDDDIGGTTSEKIGLLTTVDIQSGYTFGIVNKLSNNRNWVAYNNDELVQIAFKVKSGFSFQKGTLLEIKLLNGQIAVLSDSINITSHFEINGLKDASAQFIKNTGSYLTVHSGYFLSNQNEVLLGTVLDIISIGVANNELANLQLPSSFTTKDIFTTEHEHEHHGGGSIDLHNCNLCDLLLIILNPLNWDFTPGTPQDDIDLSDFNLEDCAEVNCKGDLNLTLADCTIYMYENPCDEVPSEYEWQIRLNGIYTTIAYGNNEAVPPIEITSEIEDDLVYRLIVKCKNGCIFSNEIFVNCISPSCSFSVTVDTSGCQLTASVLECEHPIFNWYNIYMGSTSQVGDTPTITAENDGDYYVVITGCCEDKTSDYFNMDGCLDCDCSQTLDSIQCTILVEEEECDGYVDTWQYSETGADSTWQTINYHGTAYQTTKNGNYKRILTKDGCDVISNSLEVNCFDDCSEFQASAMINSECNIVIDYSGCSEVTSIGINYNNDADASQCQGDSITGYLLGGGSVLEYVNNGQSGQIIISPDFDTTCYQISLFCKYGCVETIYFYNGICCEDSLTIYEDDCIVYADNLPCTGTFQYNWIINDTIQLTETGEIVHPISISNNGTYQLRVICADSCEYYSNESYTDCFDPECESSVMIEPEGCLMVANIINCPDADIQWQRWNGSAFEDIIGANESSYLAIDDQPLKVSISNCENCEDEEPLYFEYTPMGCESMCDCIVNVTLDEDDCILTSEETDCSNVLYNFWEQSNDNGVTWFFVAYAPFGSSYTPMENAWYRKIMVFTDGCEEEIDVEIVDCLEDCSPSLTIALSITDDCYLKAEWTGCASFESEGFGWYFSGSNQENCIGPDYPLSLPQVNNTTNNIIEFENNPANESGYIIVKPVYGEGCYFFNFQCEDCEVQQEAIWWEPELCCNEEPWIEYTTEEIEVCDYCWYNANPHEILNTIVVLPDGSVVDLNTLTNYFTFPYCYQMSCSNGNSVDDLINDINAWLDANNYEGEALPGPSAGCKAGAPYHVANTEVMFLDGDVVEGGNMGNFQFLPSSPCTDIDILTLTVKYECEGAEYLWENGETTKSIEIDIDTETPIDVTVTCPDSCIYVVTYDENNQPRTTSDDNIQQDYKGSLSKNAKDDMHKNDQENSNSTNYKIYPNPTRNEFYIEVINSRAKYIGFKLFNTQGQLVKEKLIKERADNRYAVDTDSMKPGMYYIWIEADKEAIGHQKLIIIK